VIDDADVVSGGYCQHTEGFGEMAEEENRWRVCQQISNIQFLPFLLSRSASPSYEARTRIPPAPPVAHLSRPVVADDRSTSTPAGPCDAIFDICDAEDRLWF